MTVQVGTRSQIRVVARERRLGTIVRNAGVVVTNVSTGAAATVYSDEDLTTVITSLVTDGSGVFSFYAPPGTYSISFTGSDAFEAVENVHVVGDDTSPSGSVALTAGTTFTGDVLHTSGIPTFDVAKPTGVAATDTAALLTALALASVSAKGGIVRASQGVYKWDGSATLVVPDGSQLSGAGPMLWATSVAGQDRGTVIRSTNSISDPTIPIVTCKGTAGTLNAQAERRALRNITIDCAGTAQYGVLSQDCRLITYEDVHVKGPAKAGFYCRRSSSSGPDVFHNVRLVRCQVSNAQTTGVGVLGDIVDGSAGYLFLTLTDCHFDSLIHAISGQFCGNIRGGYTCSAIMRSAIKLDGCQDFTVGPLQIESCSGGHSVSIAGTAPTGGTFTLSVAGVGTTAAIAYNAVAANVQTALTTLLGGAHATVTGGPAPGTTFTVQFDTTVTGALTGDATGLTGGAGNAIRVVIPADVLVGNDTACKAVSCRDVYVSNSSSRPRMFGIHYVNCDGGVISGGGVAVANDNPNFIGVQVDAACSHVKVDEDTIHFEGFTGNQQKVVDNGQAVKGVRALLTSEVAVSNTALETTMGLSKVVKANEMQVGTTYRIVLDGNADYISTSGTITIKVKIGTRVVATTTVPTITTGATGQPWYYTALLTCRATGAAGVVEGGSFFRGPNNTTLAAQIQSPGTIPLNSDQTLDVTVTWATVDPGNIWRSEVGEIVCEKI